jgi:hypothetical protein
VATTRGDPESVAGGYKSRVANREHIVPTHAPECALIEGGLRSHGYQRLGVTGPPSSSASPDPCSRCARRLKLLTSLWEMPASNLGRNTECPDRRLSCFSSAASGTCRCGKIQSVLMFKPSAKCVAVCPDGARSKSGSYGGLQAFIRSKSAGTAWTHSRQNI